MTCIALDDEPLALVLLEKYATQIADLELLARFTDAVAAIHFLQKNAVDLLISDINMPDMSGLQLVRDLPEPRPFVIFLTAHKEHAHEGFDLDVLDYLVKPVSPERFERAIRKAADALEVRRKAESTPPPDHFFVFSDYQQLRISIRDILYIESMGDYVKIHLSDRKRPVITLERLKNLARQLEPNGFRRIHRSYLINPDQVQARQKSQVQIADTWLPVGETYAGGWS
jgi:two-component system, LytTR family, response regulator